MLFVRVRSENLNPWATLCSKQNKNRKWMEIIMLSKPILASAGFASEKGLEGSPCEVHKLLPVDQKNPENSWNGNLVCVFRICGCTAKWCVWHAKNSTLPLHKVGKKTEALALRTRSLGSSSHNCCGSTQGFKVDSAISLSWPYQSLWGAMGMPALQLLSTPIINTAPINGLTRDPAHSCALAEGIIQDNINTIFLRFYQYWQ